MSANKLRRPICRCISQLRPHFIAVKIVRMRLSCQFPTTGGSRRARPSPLIVGSGASLLHEIAGLGNREA